MWATLGTDVALPLWVRPILLPLPNSQKYCKISDFILLPHVFFSCLSDNMLLSCKHITCSSYQVAFAGHRQCWPWPAWEPLPRGPRTNTSDGKLQLTIRHHPIDPTRGTLKVWSQQTPEPSGVNLTAWNQPTHSSSYSVVMANPHNHSALGSIPSTDISIAIKRAYTTYRMDTSGLLSSDDQEDYATGHLLNKAILPRQGDVADLHSS